MSRMPVLLILALFSINGCFSRTCTCTHFEEYDCDIDILCKWIPQHTICRSLLWALCEDDEECKDNRNPQTGEPDPDWPFDCTDFMNSEEEYAKYAVDNVDNVDSLQHHPSISTTSLTCSEIGELEGKLCKCSTSGICQGLQCEDGPDVACDNGGICCCGQDCKMDDGQQPGGHQPPQQPGGGGGGGQQPPPQQPGGGGGGGQQPPPQQPGGGGQQPPPGGGGGGGKQQPPQQPGGGGGGQQPPPHQPPGGGGGKKPGGKHGSSTEQPETTRESATTGQPETTGQPATTGQSATTGQAPPPNGYDNNYGTGQQAMMGYPPRSPTDKDGTASYQPPLYRPPPPIMGKKPEMDKSSIDESQDSVLGVDVNIIQQTPNVGKSIRFGYAEIFVIFICIVLFCCGSVLCWNHQKNGSMEKLVDKHDKNTYKYATFNKV